ncbi:DUF3768 domain-containing protein [Mesorhizobium sp. M1156]
MRAVAAFEAFDQDNDPYGEPDCAVVDIGGLTSFGRSTTLTNPASTGS